MQATMKLMSRLDVTTPQFKAWVACKCVRYYLSAKDWSLTL